MARFRCLAPYRISVPSERRKSQAAELHAKRNDFPAVARMSCCSILSSISRILRNSPSPSGLKSAILSSRLMNSGENLLRAASTPALAIFVFSRASEEILCGWSSVLTPTSER